MASPIETGSPEPGVVFMTTVDAAVLGKRTVVQVDDDALHVSNDLATMSIPWLSRTEVRADSKVVIFIRDRLLAFYVPAVAFPSPDDQDEFVADARARIARAQDVAIRS